MYSNIILPRQWSRFTCICRYSTAIDGQKLPQSNSSIDGISPPAKIHRGPTDILQALAATVGPDPTAAHYKYHDDPYLIPLSNFRKRAYALAAEAGRKAATWVRDEHAELFTTREWDPPMKLKTPYINAEPYIKAFAPKPFYNDESKVTEEDLQYTINNALVEDSIKVFQLLGGAEAINSDIKLAFLQLLCFYNEREAESLEWLEDRWFSSPKDRQGQATTWKVGGLAEKIFQSLEPKTSEAYCAIIQGMAKYFQAERAHAYAKEAIEKGIPLSTDTYNSLIRCIGYLYEGTALKTEALMSILKEMNEKGLSPNISTLTSCIRSVSHWGGGKNLQKVAMQLISEFKSLDIHPGLSAYYYLLILFCKEGGPRVDILSVILKDLEQRKSLEPEEASDINFFIVAMGVCSNHLQDINLAERLHALLMKDDNYKLLGDAYKESIYYRHYVTVTCRYAPFEKALEVLDTLIPNVYVPEPSVMEEIIKMLEVGGAGVGAGVRLADAWQQLVVFGHARRPRLVERLLAALSAVYTGQDEEVKSKMRAAAADIMTFANLSNEQQNTEEFRSPPEKLSATALSHIIELCADSKDKEDGSWAVVSNALKQLRQEQASGVPSDPTILANVAKKAATAGKLGIAASAVQYLTEFSSEQAMSASVQVLSSILNRPAEEVTTLLEQPRSSVADSLHPSALEVFEAYNLAKTGVQHEDSNSTTSSDSDSDSSDDEKFR